MKGLNQKGQLEAYGLALACGPNPHRGNTDICFGSEYAAIIAACSNANPWWTREPNHHDYCVDTGGEHKDPCV